MARLTTIAGATVVAAVAVQAQAQGQRPALRTGEVRQGAEAVRVDDYLTRLVPHGFSGAVLIASVPKGGHWATDGKVVLKKAYGLANRETGLPYTVDMVSCIGSVTKQFTGAAIMKLEMAGKLNTADPISKYLPGVPEDKAGITIHHLLTHTAGFSGDLGGMDEEPIERDALVARVLASPLSPSPANSSSTRTRALPWPARLSNVSRGRATKCSCASTCSCRPTWPTPVTRRRRGR